MTVSYDAIAAGIAVQALRAAADEWQHVAWAVDFPPGTNRPALILGMAQRAVDWLRARADRIERETARQVASAVSFPDGEERIGDYLADGDTYLIRSRGPNSDRRIEHRVLYDVDRAGHLVVTLASSRAEDLPS